MTGDGRRGGRGFTLIELLVVVLLIALTAGLVVINLQRDDTRAVEWEAMRVGALLNQMRDESILGGRALALEVTDAGAGYRFLRFEQSWQALADGDVFRPRKLPPGITIEAVEPSPVPGQEARIVATATGSLQPFELALRGEAAKVSVRLNEEGVIAVGEQEQ